MFLFLLQEPKTGANDVAGRTVFALCNLPVDKVG